MVQGAGGCAAGTRQLRTWVGGAGAWRVVMRALAEPAERCAAMHPHAPELHNLGFATGDAQSTAGVEAKAVDRTRRANAQDLLGRG